MKKIQYTFTVLLVFCLIIFSCDKNDENIYQNSELILPETPYEYNGNSNIATLGRVLFYDTRLSANNGISCASCHKQEFAFSDNTPLSRGFENKLTLRNTPPIQNLMSTSFLFWDGREKNLNNMVVMPILNHVEMGMSNSNMIVEKVKSQPYYKELFSKAYNEDEEVTIQRIALALSTFCQSINSFDFFITDFEENGSNEGGLTPQQLHGKNLFNGKYNCGSCHNTRTPQGYDFNDPVPFKNIGLDQESVDQGFGLTTNNSAENGTFRIPSLHNVALTAPYMHDGRFNTLDEVLEHYSTGIVDHPNLDEKLKDENGNPIILNISHGDKQAIIAFLNSLNAHDITSSPKFSNPFQKK